MDWIEEANVNAQDAYARAQRKGTLEGVLDGWTERQLWIALATILREERRRPGWALAVTDHTQFPSIMSAATEPPRSLKSWRAGAGDFVRALYRRGVDFNELP